MSNVILPATTPQYLTESLFTVLGFFTGSANSTMIQAAFAIAENQAATEIGTFIVPTTFTGMFPSVSPGEVIVSPVGRINSINAVQLYERYSNGVERIISGTAYSIDNDNGFFMIDASPYDSSSCNGCAGSPVGVYRADISITAGYATGSIAGVPQVQLALCMAADLVLKLMRDEGLTDAYDFVKTTQVGRYIASVTDRFAMDTAFGYSNKAQIIRNLLKPYKIYRALKVGR